MSLDTSSALAAPAILSSAQCGPGPSTIPSTIGDRPEIVDGAGGELLLGDGALGRRACGVVLSPSPNPQGCHSPSRQADAGCRRGRGRGRPSSRARGDSPPKGHQLLGSDRRAAVRGGVGRTRSSMALDPAKARGLLSFLAISIRDNPANAVRRTRAVASLRNSDRRRISECGMPFRAAGAIPYNTPAWHGCANADGRANLAWRELRGLEV